MSANVIHLADRRPCPAPRVSAPVSEVPVGGAPYVLTAQPGAVALIGHELELWLDPAEARAMGEEMIRLAAEAEGDRG